MDEPETSARTTPWFPSPRPRVKTDARDDFASTDEDTPVALDLLANDRGATGLWQIDGRSVGLGDTIELASGARVTVGEDGNVVYDPSGSTELDALDRGETGYDAFSYSVLGRGGWDAATVCVKVTGVDDDGGGNHAPVAQDDFVFFPVDPYPYPGPRPLGGAGDTTILPDDSPIFTTLATGEEGDPDPLPKSIKIAPLDNDTDADGDALTIGRIDGQAVRPGDSVTLKSGAVVTLNDDGETLSYAGGFFAIPMLQDQSARAVGGGGELPPDVLPDLPSYPYMLDTFSYRAFDGESLSERAHVSVAYSPFFYDIA